METVKKWFPQNRQENGISRDFAWNCLGKKKAYQKTSTAIPAAIKHMVWQTATERLSYWCGLREGTSQTRKRVLMPAFKPGAMLQSEDDWLASRSINEEAWEHQGPMDNQWWRRACHKKTVKLAPHTMTITSSCHDLVRSLSTTNSKQGK